MRPAAQTTLSLVIFLAFSMQAQNNNPAAIQAAQDQAVREAASRQEAMAALQTVLRDADAARKRKEIERAAGLYESAAADLFPKLQFENPTLDAEKKLVITGHDETREILARQYMSSNYLTFARGQVDTALKYDPYNARLKTLRVEIEQRAAALAGRVPSDDMIRQVPRIMETNLDAATLVQNGRLLYEMGRLDEAEKVLLQALDVDPSNRAAPYYLDLLKEARYMSDARNRERDTKTELEQVERMWLLSTTAEKLPHPGNAYATNSNINTSIGRQNIMRKLKEITLPQTPDTWGSLAGS